MRAKITVAPPEIAHIKSSQPTRFSTATEKKKVLFGLNTKLRGAVGRVRHYQDGERIRES